MTKRKSWTKTKETQFLSVLADSCNVSLAARKAGVSSSAIYRRRAKDASFRAGWDAALAEGYSKLELEMLKRALHGVQKTVFSRSGERARFREYNDQLGLALLRMHRDSVAVTDRGPNEAQVEEARERIIERLERLREKERAVETKAAVDGIGLIDWAMARK
jgi:hypothetical protein